MRRLRRNASPSVVSVLCLALGMGASAASLTLADATALRPFGLPDAGSLVVLWESDPARPADLFEISLPTFQDWASRSTAFSAMAAFGSSHWPGIARVQGDSFPVAPRAVSRDFFATLGRAPALGRLFSNEDLSPANPPPVVLSHAFWLSRFSGSPDVVGRSLFIDNEDHRIIGVMPKGFAFPDAPDVWISVERALQQVFDENAMTPVQQRGIGLLMAVGRLKPGFAASQAREELNRIELAVQKEFFPNNRPLVSVVTPFADVVLGRLGARVWIAIAMTVAVLLFACANVAALRTAHLRNRLGELSARLCLGASPRRLTGTLLMETIPLIAASTVVAVLVAGAIEAWLRQVPVVAASGIELAEFRPMTIAAIGVSALVTWLLASVAPAVSVVRGVTPADVTLGSRTIVRGSRATSVLLTVEAALALCLVAMAAGAFRTFARLAATDVGFSTADVTVVDVSVPDWKYETPEARARLDRAVVEALGELPGASAAAGVSVRPFRFGEIADGLRVRRPEDAAVAAAEGVGASRVIVTPKYFDAMGIEVLEGRVFSDFDAGASTMPVVVSQSLARALWGERSAVGNELEFYTLNMGWQRFAVIGVTADLRSRVIDRPSVELYLPHGTGGLPLGSVVVRHETARVLSEEMLRSALHSVDPDVVLDRVQTTRAVVDRVLAPSRLLSTAMSLLGAIGVVLLALGIFGAAATVLRVARREVAIRQAIGATPFKAARAPLRSLLAALAIGTAAGVALAPASLGVLASMGVAEQGGLLAAMTMAAAAVVASAGVAIVMNIRRATTASPAELLRTE
jgi:predicted permease